MWALGRQKRETLTEAGGKSVPFLIDGDVKIGDRDEIVAYLFEKYGGGYVPEKTRSVIYLFSFSTTGTANIYFI